MRNWWLYFVLTFGVAAAFALPLFMYMRERAIAQCSVNLEKGSFHSGSIGNLNQDD
jgi:hypothetical protein